MMANLRYQLSWSYLFPVILFQKRSTTVSLETYPLYMFKHVCVVSGVHFRKTNNSRQDPENAKKGSPFKNDAAIVITLCFSNRFRKASLPWVFSGDLVWMINKNTLKRKEFRTKPNCILISLSVGTERDQSPSAEHKGVYRGLTAPAWWWIIAAR